MRLLRKALATAAMLSLLMPVVLLAQTRKITGTVTDETGKPVPDVAVTIKNKPGGTKTDGDGHFMIDASTGAVLIVSSVNHEPAEIKVSDDKTVAVSLKARSTNLSDVVVVGYATQKKINLTGAVASISSKELESRPVTNVSSALAGLAPGLSVRQGSGHPGADGANILVRGLGTLNNNTPLFLVDGIQVSSIDVVNPNDIASISVLKDAASASIYGAQAANGVILITTKKGSKGKTNVTYTGLYSVSKPMHLLGMVSDYARYMKLMNESARNVGQTEIFGQTTIQAWIDASKNPNGLNAIGVPNYVAYPNTDWFDVVFENNLVKNHNISVNGGNEKATYLLSLGYLDNPGIMPQTGAKRYQLRANVEVKPAKFLTLGTQTFGSVLSSQLGNTDNLGVFNYLHQSSPGVYPLYKGKYGYAAAPEESPTANNILQYLYNASGRDLTTRLNSSVYANLALFKGFSFDSRFNYQTVFGEYNSHPNPIERWDLGTNTLKLPAGIPANISTYYSFSKSYSYTLEEILRYTTTIGRDHDISAIAGYNEYYSNNYGFDATKQGLIDYSISTLSSATTPISVNGSEADRSIRSFFGRVNYAYKGKYLLEGNFRKDGTSQFSPDTRWGLFKSFSAGWRISEESFFARWKDQVSNLKLRASWGDLGNNRVSDYVWQAAYGPVNYSFNGLASNGLSQGNFANPNLKWESTSVTNIGLDATLLHGNLDLSIDAYNKYTFDILTNPSTYLTAGNRSAPFINGPAVVNKGIELALNWKSHVQDLRFSVGGNIGYNQNMVTKYKGKLNQGYVVNSDGSKSFVTNLGDVSSGGDTRILEDHMMNEYFLLNVYRGSGVNFNSDGSLNIKGGPRDGMIRTADDLAWVNAMKAAGFKFAPVNTVGKAQLSYGDLIYADNNGDSTFGNSGDRRFTGLSATPKFIFGFNVTASWKGFDFSMIWAGSLGMTYYWNPEIYNRTITRLGNSLSNRVADSRYYFNESNPNDPANNINGNLPRLKYSSDAINTVGSDYWLYNASYIKLKNLQVGYTIHDRIAKRAFITNARVFVSAENLLMITKFPGLDPEIGSGIGYPTMKQFALGVNVSF